ncbi:hypothetical protein POX_e07068 [Penicillium oxalicum]|uniref:hypothetical protein n=1 Tax=Penicillium oxalicum TaxID=69781 RepID=UPI0020B75479|nr:hypothetical protein POX_e07068 [Penicillium oxalicum]KAI2789042.1 hypothetical protein POX_e07068 [Penicillium oxalicum]
MLGQLVGSAMLLAATAIFLYYTAWTLLMPFVDPGHPLHDLFPRAFGPFASPLS